MSDDHTQASENRGGVTGWIKRHPWVTLTLSILLAIIGFVILLDRAAGNRMNRRIAAIAARGEPVSVDDLIASDRPIPDEENMTVAVLKAARPILNKKLPDETHALLPLHGQGLLGPTGQALPQEQVEIIRSFLAQYPDEFRDMHKALTLKEAWLETDWKTPLYDVLLPELSEIRSVSKLLCLETLLAAEKGDSREASALIFDSCRALQVSNNANPFIITTFVRMAVVSLNQDMIERTINRCGLDDSSLRDLQRVVAEQETAIDLVRSMMIERVLLLDTITWLKSTGTGNLSVNGPQLGFVIPLHRIPVLRSMDVVAGLDSYDALLKALVHVDITTLTDAREVGQRAASLPSYYNLSSLLIPSLTRSVELWLRARGKSRALVTAIAAEQFRLAKGRWPASLDELVPTYLDAVPVDPFDDKPIRYAVIPEGIKTWSIGEDLKDDGGNVMRLEMPTATKKATDWGWVILNPELRGRPATLTTRPVQPTD